MKTVIYLRVAKTSQGKVMVAANTRPSSAPLKHRKGYQEKLLPTVAFGMALEIPDVAFKQAEQVIAELSIDPEQLEIAANVVNK